MTVAENIGWFRACWMERAKSRRRAEELLALLALELAQFRSLPNELPEGRHNASASPARSPWIHRSC
jgi:hypothetical protein